jgi:hypothetical protein
MRPGADLALVRVRSCLVRARAFATCERCVMHVRTRVRRLRSRKLDASAKDPSECLGHLSRSTVDAQSLSFLKLLLGNPFPRRSPGHAEHCEDEATGDVSAVVGVLVVDHVAAGSPERVSRAEDSWRLTLELEQHLTVNHVTESRTARKSMWRVSRGARWMVDENSQHMGIVGNRRRSYFLQHGDC